MYIYTSCMQMHTYRAYMLHPLARFSLRSGTEPSTFPLCTPSGVSSCLTVSAFTRRMHTHTHICTTHKCKTYTTHTHIHTWRYDFLGIISTYLGPSSYVRTSTQTLVGDASLARRRRKKTCPCEFGQVIKQRHLRPQVLHRVTERR